MSVRTVPVFSFLSSLLVLVGCAGDDGSDVGGAGAGGVGAGGADAGGAETGGATAGGGDAGGGDAVEYDFSNASLLFPDDATVDELTSEDDRVFTMSALLRTRALDNTRIEIANFIPTPLSNVLITMSIAGGPTDVVLLGISDIPAHGIVDIVYPFLDPEHEGHLFKDTQGDPVDLSPFVDAGIDPDTVSFDFSGEAELLTRLERLKTVGWEMKIHDFDEDGTHPNWLDDPTPRHARLETAFMINLAYFFTDERFLDAFLAEEIVGNDGVTLISEDAKNADFVSLMGPRRLNLGVVTAVSGLGGGETYGLADYVLRHDFLYGVQDGAAFHELGHVLGYDHDSSMTYPKDGQGLEPISIDLGNTIWAENEFPITQANYAWPTDHQIACTDGGGECPWFMECTGTAFAPAGEKYCE